MPRMIAAFMALALVLTVTSCSGKTSATSAGSASVVSTDNPSDTAALGKATFSAQVDGQPVSGGVIDGMQQQNTAYRIPNGGSGPPTLLFLLYDTKTPGDPNFSHSFRFQLPAATGPASNAHVTLNLILDSTHTARYNTSTPTITITSLTATRVSGTFSAKMAVSPDTPNAPKREITVTNGMFDIPMATSKIIPD